MRLMSWIVKMIIGTILVASLSVFTVWSAVNIYVDRLLGELHFPVIDQKISFTELLSQMTSEPLLTQDESKRDLLEPEAALEYNTDAIAVWGQTSHESDQVQDAIGQFESMIMSEEQFMSKRDSLSNEEKLRVFSLLVSKLPQAELQMISEAVEGGITAEELENVESIVKQFLSEDEYDELLQIINN